MRVSCSPQYSRAFQPGEAQLIVFQPVITRLWDVFFFLPLHLLIFNSYFPSQTSKTCHGKLSSALEHRSWKISWKIIETRSTLLSGIPIPAVRTPGEYERAERWAGPCSWRGSAADPCLTAASKAGQRAAVGGRGRCPGPRHGRVRRAGGCPPELV